MTDDRYFTGEHNLPAISENINVQHIHLYRLAKNFVADRDVLDIAGGDGFGTAILAENARSAIRIDILSEAVPKDIPLPSASVDVVVSFVPLGNIEAYDRLLYEIKRVLRADGLLILSIPEERADSVAEGPVGSFSVRAFSESEFSELLGQHFFYVSMLWQKICSRSIIECENHSRLFFEAESGSGSTTSCMEAPIYVIGVASEPPLGNMNMSGIFSQDIQSSKPTSKRTGFEEEKWYDALMKDVDHISGQVDSLQRSNWMSNASLAKVLRRMIYVRILYALSNVKVLGARRRKRFLKSAEKRDPMLLSRKVDEFCLDYYQKITANKVITASRSKLGVRNGLRVTAIVPNFNHARYLSQRLDSILAQTYPLIDILVLDDCSADDSRSVIDAYVRRFPERIKAIYNTENSGNVFRQWQKGHAEAQGDLVWICESDDFCEPTFVERLIKAFRDPSVMLAFGRIQFANSEGNYFAGLDHYREDSEPGIWDVRTVRPAAEWFRGGFGVRNVIANVGGSLWRRFDIPEETWEEARSFAIMGDWYLYSVIADAGQIAYEPSAISYFRIHESNTSGNSAQSKPGYYREYARLMAALKRRWDIPDETLLRFIEVCRGVSRGAGMRADFEELVNAPALRAISRENIHVLVGILGFSFGGGEIFPIHLANALRRKGVMVSVLQMHDADDHRDVRAMLNPGIPVYTANAVRDMGKAKFIKNAGISVVHSHVANIEAFLLSGVGVSIPFISTLHGSYEAMGIPTTKISRWSKKIDKFAYTADRNLEPFHKLRVPQSKFRKVRNAMPIDDIEFPKNRAELGVAEDAIVFSLVARGAEGKGWTEAVNAYLRLRQRRPEVPMALLMVGEGPAADAAKQLATPDTTIHFLGFVKEIYGLYRMSDVALIPTRFPGESYPLCLIQALQVGVPCVATDIGEIRGMSQLGDREAGIIIANDSDNDRFVAELTGAMEKILDKTLRSGLKENAKVLGKTYDIDVLAGEYLDEYRAILTRRLSAV